MERASHASKQRVVTLALAVLDRAAYTSSTSAVDAADVRLALAALWCILRDRRWLLVFHERSQSRAPHPWDTCREPYHGIAASLRRKGWHAPATPSQSTPAREPT